MSPIRLLVTVAATVLIQSCGGSSPSTPTPTPTPTPAPQPVVVAQGTGVALCRGCGSWYYFTLSRAGAVVTTVDYSSSDSVLWLWLTPGHCTFEMSEAHQCSWTVSGTPGQKPMKTSVNLGGGEYTFVIENNGTQDEAVSFQVVFTPSASAAGLGHGAAHESAPSAHLVPHGPSGPQSTLR